jgi:hypothetical protein
MFYPKGLRMNRNWRPFATQYAANHMAKDHVLHGERRPFAKHWEPTRYTPERLQPHIRQA